MALKIFESKKHVFWQAFFLTSMFFILGLVFGIYLEQARTDSLNVAFYQSESSLYDSFALGQLANDPSISCKMITDANVVFADKIYEEAKNLEKFDESNKLTESAKIIHRKYDLLRTLLWMNPINIKENCNANTIVYLYAYKTDNMKLKAEQIVWSRILEELKYQMGNEVILIPIAADQDITSLDYLIEKYEIKEFPAVIINEKDVLYEHKTTKELSEYFK